MVLWFLCFKLEWLSLPFTSTFEYNQARLEPIRVVPFPGIHNKDRLIFLPANIRLGGKCTAMTNTLAYYKTATKELLILGTNAGKQLS
jgi:hypothetical protein